MPILCNVCYTLFLDAYLSILEIINACQRKGGYFQHETILVFLFLANLMIIFGACLLFVSCVDRYLFCGRKVLVRTFSFCFCFLAV